VSVYGGFYFTWRRAPFARPIPRADTSLTYLAARDEFVAYGGSTTGGTTGTWASYSSQGWVAADLAVCEERDVKGLYAKARAGEIPEFTGISAPYEVPSKPELTVDTGKASVDESVQELVQYLEKVGVLSNG